MGAWVPWQGAQWDTHQQGLFLSLGHVSSSQLVARGAGNDPWLCFMLEQGVGGTGRPKEPRLLRQKCLRGDMVMVFSCIRARCKAEGSISSYIHFLVLPLAFSSI